MQSQALGQYWNKKNCQLEPHFVIHKQSDWNTQMIKYPLTKWYKYKLPGT